MRLPRFWLLLVLAWLAVLAQLMAIFWPATALTMPDADDALRLVQVRSFLAGQGWFDLHEARLGPPAGYDSHWSRLIDAGLAGLYLAFGRFVDPALAERLMAAVWPILWLLPTIGGAAALAWRVAGRDAAFIVLLFAVFGMTGMAQFRPGRIDHHNVQIALAVLVVAATAWSDRVRWACWGAGLLTRLALAIGLESLPILVACTAAFALRWIGNRDASGALRDCGLALAASTTAAFLVSVPSDHWEWSACDAIAINLAAPVTAGGLALAAIALRTPERRWVRWGVAAMVAAVTLAAFLLLEPRCLRGPYAMMDAALGSILLAHMSEMQPLAELAEKMPMAAVGLAAFPMLAAMATIMLGRGAELRRDFGFLVASAAFLLTLGMTVLVTKMAFYAMWLGVPLVVAACLRAFEALRLDSLVGRFAALLLVTPTTVTVGAVTIATAAGVDGYLNVTSPDGQACTRKDNYATLARLPTGLVVASHLELGSFLLAWTPHSVLAAPYHRLSGGIIMAHNVFARPPGEAHAILTGVHATYVVTCGPMRTDGINPQDLASSLGGRLQAGDVPAWLERVPETEGGAFAAYRVKPGGSQ
jgi:hypothetical protein